jgi:hypothetical protein
MRRKIKRAKEISAKYPQISLPVNFLSSEGISMIFLWLICFSATKYFIS